MNRHRPREGARPSWFVRITQLLAVIALPGGAGGIARGPADAASSPPPPGAGLWTVYHGDPAGDGMAPPVSAVNTTASVWVSPALDGQIYGEPLVSGSRVYVATENDTVYALSATAGTVAWSAHLGSPVPARSLPCGGGPGLDDRPGRRAVRAGPRRPGRCGSRS